MRRRSNGASARGLSMVKAVAQYIVTKGYDQFPNLSPAVSIESIDPQDEFFHEYTVLGDRSKSTADSARVATKTQAWLLKVDFTNLISDNFALELAEADAGTAIAPDAETKSLLEQAGKYFIFLETMFDDMTVGDFISWYMITDQVDSIKKDQRGRWIDFRLTTGFSAHFVPLKATKNWKSMIPKY